MGSKSVSKDLPPRMLRRIRHFVKGRVWEGFYYDGRDENGRRKEIPLGTDLHEAKRKWAELESKSAPVETGLMKHVFDRYERDIMPTKAPRTQKDNIKELAMLRRVFDTAPIDAITPQHIARYRDERGAAIRANREIALLSHAFNFAREWGYTSKENPAKGVRKNKETPRSFYIDDAVFSAVLDSAPLELRHAMQLAYLTGQRPADVRKMHWSDVSEGHLLVKQGKTGKKIRVVIEGALAETLDSIRARKIASLYILCSPSSGQPLSYTMLRKRFDVARAQAANKHPALAEKIKSFQFRDIRAKSASDTDIAHASALLGHTTQQITAQVYRRVGATVKPTK